MLLRSELSMYASFTENANNLRWPVRRILRLVWWIVCTAAFCALPLTVWEFKSQGYSTHWQAWFVGGMFVILAIPISIYEVAMHTEYYTRPKLQRHVIRILWMVPIYALDSWFALRFKDARFYLDPIRECYEAFVIYNFFAYLMNFLEDELGDVEEALAHKGAQPHFFPVSWVASQWEMGPRFLRECKRGILNYVIVRPVVTLASFIAEAYGVYGQGSLNPAKAWIWLALVTNFSQMWAMYCLIMLYITMHDELAPIRPLSKFVCIKAVIFLTFWQSVAIAILVWSGVIRSKESWTTYDVQDVAAGLQDFAICIEMFIAALAHAYAFPVRDYMDPNVPTKGFLPNLVCMFDLRDIVVDMQEVVADSVPLSADAKRKAQDAKRKPSDLKRRPSKTALLPTTTSTPAGMVASLLATAKERLQRLHTKTPPMKPKKSADGEELLLPASEEHVMPVNGAASPVSPRGILSPGNGVAGNGDDSDDGWAADDEDLEDEGPGALSSRATRQASASVPVNRRPRLTR